MFRKLITFLIFGLSLWPNYIYADNYTNADKDLPEFIFAYDSNDGFQGFTESGDLIPDENPGYDVELLLMVQERVPVQFRFKRMPWKRCLTEMGEGNVSGVNGSYKSSRENLGVYPRMASGELDATKRIASGDYVLATLKDSNLEFDHQKKKFIEQSGAVAAPQGYSIVSDFKKYGINVLENKGGVLPLMKMLALGRVEGILAHRNSIQYEILKNPEFKDVIIKEPAIKSKNYFLIISHQFYRKHPQLSQQIWDTLEEIREEHGQKMYEKYLSV